ncbi:hypothetical protein D3C72_2346720 [compost metagenome]
MEIGDRFHFQHVQANQGTIDPAAVLASQLAPRVLGPAARSATKVDNHLARFDQFLVFIDFFELVCCPGAVALFLRQLHIRIIYVVVQPVFV